jgi:hypothetical protein
MIEYYLLYLFLGMLYVLKKVWDKPFGHFTDMVGCMAIYWPICIIIEIFTKEE